MLVLEMCEIPKDHREATSKYKRGEMRSYRGVV